jgi:hypothetical protein
LLAGHETTINLLCNGTGVHPASHGRSQRTRSAGPKGTEECLRYDAPVVDPAARLADIEVRDKVMARTPHPLVHLLNRDPNVFTDHEVRHPGSRTRTWRSEMGSSLPRGDIGAGRGRSVITRRRFPDLSRHAGLGIQRYLRC